MKFKLQEQSWKQKYKLLKNNKLVIQNVFNPLILH